MWARLANLSALTTLDCRQGQERFLGPLAIQDGPIIRQTAILKFRMFKLDLDKTWVICVFSGAFALLVLYALWPYIAAAIVVYAIAQELSAPRHLGNRRSCRRWIGRLNCR